MRNNKSLLIVLIVVIGIFILYSVYYYSKDNSKSTSNTKLNDPGNIIKTEINENTTDFTFDALQAMHYYYFSTQFQSAEGEEVSTMLINMMTSMMNSVNRLESGNRTIASYLNSGDEQKKLIAQGMTTGANVVIAAENDFTNYLKNIDENEPNTYKELEYQLAKRNSGEKEGYSTIAISAAQIGYLFFETTESENPKGPITYKISKQERESILKEIDRLFSEELEEFENSTGDVNAVIFGIHSLRNLLLPDTYEEAAKLES